MLWITVLLLGTAAAGGFDDYRPEHSDADELGENTLRTLRSETTVTRSPCVCNDRSEICNCCGRVDQTTTGFHARSCGIVRYGDRRSRSLRYEVNVNNRLAGRTQAAATKDPIELCVPAAFLTICSRFFNVEYQNATFTFCFRFDVKYSRFTLLSVEFDCVRAALVPGIYSKGHIPSPPQWVMNVTVVKSNHQPTEEPISSKEMVGLMNRS